MVSPRYRNPPRSSRTPARTSWQTYNVGRWVASTVGQTFARIEPGLLEHGHTYLIAVTASVGRPNLDTGDYLTFGLPAESATVWSSTFVVADR